MEFGDLHPVVIFLVWACWFWIWFYLLNKLIIENEKFWSPVIGLTNRVEEFSHSVEEFSKLLGKVAVAVAVVLQATFYIFCFFIVLVALAFPPVYIIKLLSG